MFYYTSSGSIDTHQFGLLGTSDTPFTRDDLDKYCEQHPLIQVLESTDAQYSNPETGSFFLIAFAPGEVGKRVVVDRKEFDVGVRIAVPYGCPLFVVIEALEVLRDIAQANDLLQFQIDYQPRYLSMPMRQSR